MFRKDVTDAEVESFMKPHLDELMRRVVFANPDLDLNEDDPSSSKSSTRNKSKPDKKEQRETKNNEKLKLSVKEKEYLFSVDENSQLTTVQRAETNGLSAYMSNRIKSKLVDLGLVEEFSVNLGKGGNPKFLVLTKEGYRFLGKESPKSKREVGCSHEHYWWQEGIAINYEKKGYVAEIEKNLNGKKVDVVLGKNGQLIGIEIELTPKNAVNNVKKDLETNALKKVIVACKNSNVKQAVEKKFEQALGDQQWELIKIILLTDFSFVKDILK